MTKAIFEIKILCHVKIPIIIKIALAIDIRPGATFFDILSISNIINVNSAGERKSIENAINFLKLGVNMETVSKKQDFQ